jgi:hypothetical protein
VVSQYPTIRAKGVYYIQDMQFEPSVDGAETSTTPTTEHRHTSASTKRGMIAKLRAQERPMDDFLNRGEFEVLLDYVPTPTGNPAVTPLMPTLSAQSATKTEADMLAYEVWHQRMAHCSEAKLRKTQQHVDGIPTFQTKQLPSLIAVGHVTLRHSRKHQEDQQHHSISRYNQVKSFTWIWVSFVALATWWRFTNAKRHLHLNSSKAVKGLSATYW